MRPHRHFKQNRPKKNQLIAGADAVLRAITEGVEIERIYLLQTLREEKLLSVAERQGIPVNKVPAEKLKGFNIEGHNGVVALKSKIIYRDLQDLISQVVEEGNAPLLLLLDGITDIRNIGGIARTAWCCGVHAIVIPSKGVGSLNEEAIATSAGALEHIPVCREKDLGTIIEVLKLNGIAVLASEMTAKTMVYELDFTLPAAVIMGSEDMGIHPSVYSHCDEVFAIPMRNNFESLNVSAATAIILYEAMKQRLQG
ncbi:MAG TPA: 23S rRNA (guanosine(2251)-2'-O)-methyltransferase RlmB [Ginsengibacter sp.]|nr:23S rRNA (guanosine(2251)-2'-O)-methyltransferase RlmB [Ginsengibacter sp.]HRP44496.1 23S rRNA (guanosine(2251)-2'-O)-methyltransferase RlmB [Ginsengibacter sp.]